MKKICRIVAMLMSVIFIVCMINIPVNAEGIVNSINFDDVIELNGFKISNFKLSTKTPDIQSEYKLSFDIDETPGNYEIASAYVAFNEPVVNLSGSLSTVGPVVVYDSEKNKQVTRYEVGVSTRFYGVYEIAYIEIKTVDGSRFFIYNSDSNNDMSNYIKDGAVPVSLSKYNVEVLSNGIVDNECPSIDINSIKISNATPKKGEKVRFSFKAFDANGIGYVDIGFETSAGAGRGCWYRYDNSLDEYYTEITMNTYDTYSLREITVVDTMGNATVWKKAPFNIDMYKQSEKRFINFSAKELDFSAYQIKCVSSSNQINNSPLVLDESSIYVEKKSVARGERNRIFFKTKDNAEISFCNISLRCKNADYGLGYNTQQLSYDASTGYFSLDLYCNIYGTYEIYSFDIFDAYGKHTVVYNTEYSKLNDDSAVLYMFRDLLQPLKLESCNFDVGLKDPTTGIYITGNGMKDDIKLDVIELEKKGSDYDKMHDSQKEVDSFYNVNTNNRYDGEIEVKIPVSIANDSQTVTVKHLKHDGTIQEQECIVNEGFATIMVDEFSPFMVEANVNSNVVDYRGKNAYFSLQTNGGKWTGSAYYLNGSKIVNTFFSDGLYTYYLQADGTPMKNRLTYHPDGKHIIYFDENGHEVFSNFAHVKKAIAGNAVDDYCFFDVHGYMYVDVMTYDVTGKKLYYVNPYGQIERKGWFKFSNTAVWAGTTKKVGAGWGYGQSDGTLMINKWTKNKAGKKVYMQGDGHMK